MSYPGSLFAALMFLLLGRRAAGLTSSPALPPSNLLPPAPSSPLQKAQQQAATQNAQAQQATQDAQAAKRAAEAPRPWPQATPAGLPPFPGPGWKPAEPPPSAVVSRAWQLLSSLWAKGVGSWKAEQTGPSWYIYQARWTGPKADKKGVVAWRPSGVVTTAPRQSDARV